ncbi:MAG TPA: endolytic transglycosylase MltG, partial [Microbacteriaceae bacterium]|nr:endolytic transglycosylase MltG [Microbacteriaceae bacterium]
HGRRLLVAAIVVVLLAVGAGLAYSHVRPEIQALSTLFQPDDYTGQGSGSVYVTIRQGDTGSVVATRLHRAGVVKTSHAFYRLLLGTSPAPVFQPGTYELKKRMSSAAALRQLETPGDSIARVTVPEGMSEADVLARLSQATGTPLAILKKTAADPRQFGLPAAAKTLEGYLFPATYTFDPGTSAHEMITRMVDRTREALRADDVPAAREWDTIILASIVQREAGPAGDMGKIARVFQNRLDRGMLLQSDATVAYGTGNTSSVWTTNAERDDAKDPYNTYVHHGLPVGPIGNPGDEAIRAALHPTPGPWLYFVPDNLKTGHTVFSVTGEQHAAAVKRLQEWCKASKENSAYCN